jgi:two-component system, LytTR family, sensor kinase
MMDEEQEETLGAAVRPRVALLSILGFWAFYFAMNTLRMLPEPAEQQLHAAGKRAAVVLIGMVLSCLLYLVLRPLDHKPLGRRIFAAFLASVPISFAYAAVNYTAFYVFDPSDQVMTEIAKYPEKMADPITMMINSAMDWYFFIVAWAVLYIALSYAEAVRDAERRAASFRAAAQSAEIRALRYQVNPHFLFNTLNSLSSLILTGKREGAERMIMNLSTFFRTSLTADPTEDVTLAEEIRLQRLYLDIEEARFPERLAVEIDVPDSLLTACVPCLILQPLIENAIKYGVSRSSHPVTVRIAAHEDPHGLVLSVEDDGQPAQGGEAEAEEPDGTRTGLRNVRDRLVARFGKASAVRWGARPGGGFVVTLFMPIVRHGC